MEETKTDYALMKETEQNKRALLREDKCDKYDYLAAVACGAVGGLVDIFLLEHRATAYLENGQIRRLIVQ